MNHHHFSPHLVPALLESFNKKGQICHVSSKHGKQESQTAFYSLTHCGRVRQICVFNTVKLGTSAISP